MAAAKSKTADPAPPVGAGLGRIAYDAYVAATGQKSALAWDVVVEKNHDVAAAWCAAAQAVITATIERNS